MKHWRTFRSSLCLACCTSRDGSETRQTTTPLPWGKLLVVCTIFFVHQFGINLLFPFLPYMIQSFFHELDRTQIGQKAGYLGCAYFVGNFIGSLFWGWVSDIAGRRPALLFGMCGIIFSEVLFAFSQNFAWAVAARFLWGALNGIMGISKTYVSDICDDSNQARGFALLGVSRGVGQMLGSAVGGFLAQPAHKYPGLQFEVFCQFPYSLPVLVAAGLCFIALFVGWLFLDETKVKKKVPADSALRNNGSDVKLPETESDTEMIELNDKQNQDAIDQQPLLIAESDVDTDNTEEVHSDTELLLTERQTRVRVKWPRPPSCNPLYPCIKLKERLTDCVTIPVAIYRSLKSCSSRRESVMSKESVSTKMQLFCKGVKRRALLIVDRRVFFSTLLYGLFAFVGVMSMELTPLLLVTEHEDGGYSLDDTELGVIFTVAALLEFLYNVLLFPKITKWIGFRNTFRLGVTLFVIMCILLPFSNQITGPVAPSNSSLLDNDTIGSGMSNDDNTENFCSNYTPVLNFSLESPVNVNSILRVPASIWIMLIFTYTVTVISRVMTFTATMILINNSSLLATKGMVNGIGQALAATGRAVGPAVGAPLFAWSEGTGLGWPLNFHFMFDIMALFSVGIIVLSLFLPKSIERKREAPHLPSTVAITNTHSVEDLLANETHNIIVPFNPDNVHNTTVATETADQEKRDQYMTG